LPYRRPAGRENANTKARIVRALVFYRMPMAGEGGAY